jgi:hypothetical protein
VKTSASSLVSVGVGVLHPDGRQLCGGRVDLVPGGELRTRLASVAQARLPRQALAIVHVLQDLIPDSVGDAPVMGQGLVAIDHTAHQRFRPEPRVVARGAHPGRQLSGLVGVGEGVAHLALMDHRCDPVASLDARRQDLLSGDHRPERDELRPERNRRTADHDSSRPSAPRGSDGLRHLPAMCGHPLRAGSRLDDPVARLSSERADHLLVPCKRREAARKGPHDRW